MKRFGLILTLLAVLSLTACTDTPGATRALYQQGYTEIEITGYSAFGCGEDYTFATEFKAVSTAKIPVTGVVCSGFLKGYSIKTF